MFPTKVKGTYQSHGFADLVGWFHSPFQVFLFLFYICFVLGCSGPQLVTVSSQGEPQILFLDHGGNFIQLGLHRMAVKTPILLTPKLRSHRAGDPVKTG